MYITAYCMLDCLPFFISHKKILMTFSLSFIRSPLQHIQTIQYCTLYYTTCVQIYCTTQWFYRYRGSMTMPPCVNDVRWRVLDKPLKISTRQLHVIEYMIATARDPLIGGCSKVTVGKPRHRDTTTKDSNSNNNDANAIIAVDVNRPLQRRSSSSQHNLKYCDSDDFCKFLLMISQ
jgi:hypothetical protein